MVLSNPTERSGSGWASECLRSHASGDDDDDIEIELAPHVRNSEISKNLLYP